MASDTKSPSILDKIYEQRAKDVEIAKSTPGTTPKDLSTLLDLHLAPPLIPLIARLKRNPSSQSANPSPSLMAEIKRASPSKGAIALEANAAEQARTYALAGASVISVLTEPTWFKGSLLDLRLAREAIANLPDRPALLRKDFILDEYQIDEARLYGADTVLLIVAMLSEERLKALYHHSLSRGMEPLVEVNNSDEMKRAIDLGAKAIGVNNRNLHDFQVDMGTTSRLADMLKGKDDTVLCALSGISNNTDVKTYAQQGVRAVLVGEALMRANDTGKFIQTLLGWPDQPPLPLQYATSKIPWVKASGITSINQAKAIIEAGADMIGFIFDTSERFHITPSEAHKITASLRAERKAVPAPPFAKARSTPARNTPWFTTHMVNLVTTAHRPVLVGIFKNQSLPFIIHTIQEAELDMVQLNGNEPSSWAGYIPVPIIRRFLIDDGVAEQNPSASASVQWGLNDLTRPGFHCFAQISEQNTVVEGMDTNRSHWRKVIKAIQGGEGHNFPMPLILDMTLPLENFGNEIYQIVPWALEVNRTAEMGFSSFVVMVKEMKQG